MAILVAGLHVQRLAKQLTLFDILQIHAFTEQAIVIQQLRDGQVTGFIRTVQGKRWHAARDAMTGEAASLITAKHGRHFGRDVVTEVGDVINEWLWKFWLAGIVQGEGESDIFFDSGGKLFEE